VKVHIEGDTPVDMETGDILDVEVDDLDALIELHLDSDETLHLRVITERPSLFVRLKRAAAQP
jgi:hypothetical protein